MSNTTEIQHNTVCVYYINYFFRKYLQIFCYIHGDSYRGAGKSLARPGRKQATATKLWHLQATQKLFRSLSVQPGLRGSNDPRVRRKMTTFQLFFQSGRAKDLSAPLCNIYSFSTATLATQSSPMLRHTYTASFIIHVYHRKCVYCVVRIQSSIVIQVKFSLPHVKISDPARYSRKHEWANDTPYRLVSASVFWGNSCLHLHDRPWQFGRQIRPTYRYTSPRYQGNSFQKNLMIQRVRDVHFVNEIPLSCCD